MLWEDVCNKIQVKIGEAEFKSWIKPLVFKSIDDGTVCIECPSLFIKNWIEAHLMLTLKNCLTACLPDMKSIRVKLIVNSNKKSREPDNIAVLPTAIVEPVATQSVDTRYTFDNFVVGKPNELAYAAALKIAESQKVQFNPLFLYGGVGLGKTHLMHAIANRIKQVNPKRRVVYLSAEQFMYEFIKAIRSKDTMGFKSQFRNIDVLMVDDVQFFSTANATQEEFFHTFNVLIDNNKQIIISADKSPSDLENIQERLKSRMNWGLVADIHPTTYELRLGILQSKVEKTEYTVPNMVLEFLACKITSNVRELEGALNRVMAHAELVGKDIDLDLVIYALKDVLKAQEKIITVNDIQECVSEYYGLKRSDLKSACRRKSISRPRHMAMYFCKQMTPMSLPEIGREFGGKDHTSVMYAVNNVEKLKKLDPHFSKELDTISRMLNAS
jgi:chromosomal replication initiator protein